MKVLQYLLLAISFGMTYVVISTCFKSNLLNEWSNLAQIPWMQATLWDFYANTFLICLWLFQREKNLMPKILWTLGFVCLGSIATCFYAFLALRALKPEQELLDIFRKKP